MSVVDEVLTRYSLQDNYSGPARRVAAASAHIAAGHNQAKAANHDLNVSFSDLTKGTMDSFSALSTVGSMAASAFLLVGGAYAGASAKAMQAAAEWDALVAALVAVEGSASKAEVALRKVREAARAPGLGQREALQGYTSLVRSGLSDDFALRTLREFGNMNATSGGGKAQLDQLIRAVAQIANKPFLQGDELLQLMEAGVPAYKMVKDIFGTADTEELKRRGIDSQRVLQALVAELEKMPRVAGGAKNSFENLSDAIDFGMVTIGQSLNAQLLPFVDRISGTIDAANNAGVFADLGGFLADTIANILGAEFDDTDALLLDIVVEAKTIAVGMQNLSLNFKGFSELIGRLANFPFGPNAPTYGDATNVPALEDIRQGFLDTAEMQKQLMKQQRKRAEEESYKVIGGAEKPSPTMAAMQETAANTRALVNFEKRKMDLQRSMYGGGDTFANIFSPTSIRRNSTGSRGTKIGAVIDALEALFDGIENPRDFHLARTRAGY